jgi:hypothetical protein
MHISLGIWVSPAIILTLVILIWGYIKHAWAYTFRCDTALPEDGMKTNDFEVSRKPTYTILFHICGIGPFHNKYIKSICSLD